MIRYDYKGVHVVLTKAMIGWRWEIYTRSSRGMGRLRFAGRRLTKRAATRAAHRAAGWRTTWERNRRHAEHQDYSTPSPGRSHRHGPSAGRRRS